MMRIRYWIRSFFGFSRNETNGFLILLPIMLLIIFSNTLYKKLIYQPTDHAKENAYLDSLVATMEFKVRVNGDTVESEKFKPFVFNPNTASLNEFNALGLPNFLSKRIIAYRSKGGTFSSPSDLLKIYGMDTLLYTSLQPYILIPQSNTPTQSSNKKVYTKKKPVFISFDLNQADTSQLKSIYGIGPVLASRIIKFRDQLGGFIEVNQLRSVYGLDSATCNKLIHKSFIASDFVPKKINLNTASVKELASHPFLSYKLSKTIVAYRLQHGSFNEIDDLLKIDLIDKEVLTKIRPYLILEP